MADRKFVMGVTTYEVRFPISLQKTSANVCVHRLLADQSENSSTSSARTFPNGQ